MAAALLSERERAAVPSAGAASTPRVGEASEPQGGSLITMMLAVVVIPAVLGSSKTIFGDGDVSWHIATGQWILAHHAIPHTDPFSFTWAGKPWVPIEWLAELIYGAAYSLARYGGVAALVTAALMALHAIIFANAFRNVRPLIAIVAMDFVLVPMLLARPHVLVWPLLAFWLWLMLRARENDRAPPIAAALLMTFWANLHGSFVLGLAIAGLFGLEALVFSSDRVRVLRQWVPFAIACIAATLLNANGLAGVVHPLRMENMQTLPLIDEWKPSNPKVTPFFFAVLALTLAFIAWKRPRLLWTRWLLLAGMLGLALLQVRHQAMLAIIAAMILPQGLKRNSLEAPSVDRSAVAMAWAVAAALIIARAVLPLSPPENETNPWKLIAAVPPQYRSQPVLNGYSMGGPLILAGVRPYIDGRGDMYGDALVSDYVRITSGDEAAFNDAVRRWNISWVIVPHRSHLVELLDRSAGWRRLASDEAGVVFVRRAP
jgi:hypothetical protein